MSAETLTWLNQNTLIGFVAKRGPAWHRSERFQGAEDNHYDGALPVDDVIRRLFNFEVVKGTANNTYITASGITTLADTARFPVGRADTGHTFGYFADSYEIHPYDQWLVSELGNIIDGDLSIGSAGLLRNGAQAWVSIEVPDNIVTPEGVEFRPNLLACTSHDGSLATTYKRAVTNVVCDNTMRIGLAEHGQQLKIKHSKYSKLRLTEAREALAIMHAITDDFAANVQALCQASVTDKQWAAFLDAHLPTETNGEAKKGRALTMAINERDALTQLWNSDERVTPWRGTAYGVVQAVNTHAHHGAIVRNVSRAERNMSRAITGDFDTLDSATVNTLMPILANV